MKKKIQLKNRDNISIWLERNNDGYYTLETDGDIFYKKYLRLIGDNQDKPEAVDPPGGPFLSVGSIIDNMKIDCILTNPLRFYLKEV